MKDKNITYKPTQTDILKEMGKHAKSDLAEFAKLGGETLYVALGTSALPFTLTYSSAFFKSNLRKAESYRDHNKCLARKLGVIAGTPLLLGHGYFLYKYAEDSINHNYVPSALPFYLASNLLALFYKRHTYAKKIVIAEHKEVQEEIKLREERKGRKDEYDKANRKRSGGTFMG